MTWVLAAALVICLVAVGVLVRRLSATSASAKAATRTIEDTKGQLAAARQKESAAQASAAAARVEVEQAHTATEQAQARAQLAESGLAFTRQEVASSRSQAHLESLWALACLEQGRAWRLTMALPEDPGSDSGPHDLVGAVRSEIERIREETGTPGRLEADLPGDVGAADAVVVYRALQALLAVLARYSDAFDLHVGVEDGQMVAALVCEGFDGPDTVADEATALLQALAGVQGEIDVDRDAEGRLEARLTIPLTP